jgi:hypothetical protein
MPVLDAEPLSERPVCFLCRAVDRALIMPGGNAPAALGRNGAARADFHRLAECRGDARQAPRAGAAVASSLETPEESRPATF